MDVVKTLSINIASGKGAEILRKVAETSRKFAEHFLQWLLPERPHKLRKNPRAHKNKIGTSPPTKPQMPPPPN